jgi:hypothetical protein
MKGNLERPFDWKERRKNAQIDKIEEMYENHFYALRYPLFPVSFKFQGLSNLKYKKQKLFKKSIAAVKKESVVEMV